MKSKSVFKKLAMFVIVLALVMSFAGPALADSRSMSLPSTVNIVYDLNGGGDSFSEPVAVADMFTHPTATFTLPTVTRAGYVLTGWSRGAAGATVTVGACFDLRSFKWCDICVKAEWMEVKEFFLYNVDYTGTYRDGALFWPADVVNATTAPTIAGVPYRAGYYFSGWMPGTLDWTNADKTVVERVVTSQCQPSFIERITTYTIHVSGSFSLEPVPPVVVVTEDVPLAAPQTGSAPVAAYAVVLAVLAAATVGYALIRRRDS